MKLLTILLVFLGSVTASAAMQFVDNAGLNLGAYHRFVCGAGLTCSKNANGYLDVAADLVGVSSTIGTGLAEDVWLAFDGNAQDFSIGLDDSVDLLTIGYGLVPGTTDAIRIDAAQDVTIVQNLLPLSAIGIGAAATFVDSDATPDVSDGSNFETNTTAVTITDFDGAGIYEGQVIVVVSKGAITFDVTTSGIVGGTTDIITATGDVTSFMYDGADWLVTARIDKSDDLN